MGDKTSDFVENPILPTVFAASVLLIASSASADVFSVTEEAWGTAAQTGTFAWALDQANATSGADVIDVKKDLQISVDFVDSSTLSAQWLSTITESVRIQGNGAKLIGNPTYVTSGGLIATKTNIVGSAYKPAITEFDIIAIPAFSFVRIGELGADNSSISVDIVDLDTDGLASVAETRSGATLSVTGGDFTNLVNYTKKDAVGRSVFQAAAGSTLNISDVSISRHFPFDDAIDVAPDAVVFFGSILGQDAQLNLKNSSINSSFGAGAISWLGGEANIVSSVVEDAGGLSILDSKNSDGELNLVNSVLYMAGGDSLSQTNRIMAAVGGEANVIGSSVLFDALTVDESCMGIAFECNGMPLTATLGGTLNFNSSVAALLNSEFTFPGLDSYSEYSSGNLVADDLSFILETPTQNQAVVQSLFENTNIQTSGNIFEIQDFGTIKFFLPLPSGATPVWGGALSRFVPDAGIGGANALINPIDSSPLLFDVFGNPRVSASGFRDIGAVQAVAPVPLPSSLLLLMGGVGALLMSARRRPGDRQEC